MRWSRRSQAQTGPKIVHGPLVLDTLARRAQLNGAPLDLAAREWAVLEVLLARVEKIVSKEAIIQAVANWGEELTPNAIEVYVSRLRAKLDPAGVKIRTVRGFGYMLEEFKERKRWPVACAAACSGRCCRRLRRCWRWARSGSTSSRSSPRSDAYDQALMDVGHRAGRTHPRQRRRASRFDLPRVAEQVLRTDRYDIIYYVVRGPDGATLAGDPGLPPVPAGEEPEDGVIAYDGDVSRARKSA